MAIAVAVHKLAVTDPNVQMTHTGCYDREGNPILRKSRFYVHPGEFFETETYFGADEMSSLLDGGAIRIPDEMELVLYEKQQKEVR